MPAPRPNRDESRDKFVSRCATDATMLDDYPDRDQRLAVCYGLWDNSKGIDTMEHKSVGLEIKQADSDGTVIGYGSVFGTEDLGGDIVEKGAFEDSLRREMPLMLWGHDFSKPPIGKWTAAKEDDRGLLLEGKLFLDAGEDIRKIHIGLKSEAITGLSIGFFPIVHEWDDEKEVRRIKKVALKEVSFVNFPMNEEARIESVKTLARLRRGDIPSKQLVELALREAGFTRQQAKGLLARGYHGLEPRDATPDDVGALAESMRAIEQTLRG